jgi:hypothetical protein
MKKITSIFMIVLSIVLLFGIASAASADGITVLDYTRPNGLTQRITAEIANLEGFNPNMVSLGDNNCAKALKYLKDTKEPTITVWFWFSNELGGSNEHCKNLDADLFITSYAKTYLNVCSKFTEDNINMFRNGNFKIGYPAFYKTEAKILADLLKELSINNVQFVPYAVVPDVMAALEIGEISYGIFITPSAQNNCEITLNPIAPENRVSVYSFSEGNVDVRPIYVNYAVIGVNVDQEFIRRSVAALTNSIEWQEKFPNFYDDVIEIERNDQLKMLLSDLEYMRNFYEQ